MAPSSIDANVLALLARIASPEEPQFLPVKPERYAQMNECIAAVDEKVRRDGGSRLMGWQIWEGDIVIEGEMHAVWRANDGTLHDITPKRAGIDRILFLPDPRLVYEGRQIDNVRMNISGNSVGDDFIRASEGFFRLMNKAERATQSTVSLTGKDVHFHDFLVKIKMGTEAMVRQGLGEQTPCLCPSGKPFAQCHRLQLTAVLEEVDA